MLNENVVTLMRRTVAEPELSIIICTYNRADLLGDTLKSLLKLKSLERVEAIVVDNRSTDQTAEVVEDFINNHGHEVDIRYLFEQEQGLSAARNAGIDDARGQLIAFLDDDAIPAEEWAATIIETFRSMPRAVALGGKIAPIFEIQRPEWLVGPLELPYTIIDLGDSVREYPAGLNPFGANMAMRRSAFNEERFPLDLGRKGDLLLSGEESWLFEQIRKKGGLVIYHPDMAVDHFVPAGRLTKDWILHRYYCQGISNAVMNTGLRGRIGLMGKTAAKALYVLVDSILARTEGRKLLNRCRMESIRGTLHTVWSRKRESAAG